MGDHWTKFLPRISPPILPSRMPEIAFAAPSCVLSPRNTSPGYVV